jgi:hypothetical protein
MSLFEPIFAALENGAIRYVVVGGMATVLHGYARLTADVDIIVDQQPDEALKAIRALTALGFVPRAPVSAEDYANARSTSSSKIRSISNYSTSAVRS